MRSQSSVLVFWGFLLLIGYSPFYTIHAHVHYYDFIVKEKNYTRLCGTKSMLVVNDSFPGPVIRVHKGDTLYVNVYNQGDYGLTIHWHGVKQPRNPWYDGPEYITQCPIKEGTNFTYEVIFSKEEGTLWWHAHSDWTRASVHGAIVILPAVGSTFPFPKSDEEEILVLGSWYSGDLKELIDEAMEAGSDLPHSVAYTINGQPGDFCNCSQDTTYRWRVHYGKTYLLRIVNAVVNAELFFAIAQHNVTVVGMDGAYLKPFHTSYIMISTGQTIDVLVTAKSPGHYYMAARQFYTVDQTIIAYDHVNATSILEYTGNYSINSCPEFPSNLPWYTDYEAAQKFSSSLRSLANADHPVNVPLDISTRMFITVSMNSIYCRNESCSGVGGNKLGSSLNNISWTNPMTTDVLLAYYRNMSGVYESDFPDLPPSFYNFTGDHLPDNITFTVQGRKVKVLNYNETIEIIFQGTNVDGGAVNHPMHMHGYSFYVVGFGSGNFDNQSDPKFFNLVDPPEVTTFAIPRKGWIAIRFTANNPGVWFWHCHLDRHMSWGMDTVFIVKNGSTAETSMRQAPPYMPSCHDSSKSWLHIINEEHDVIINDELMK